MIPSHWAEGRKLHCLTVKTIQKPNVCFPPKRTFFPSRLFSQFLASSSLQVFPSLFRGFCSRLPHLQSHPNPHLPHHIVPSPVFFFPPSSSGTRGVGWGGGFWGVCLGTRRPAPASGGFTSALSQEEARRLDAATPPPHRSAPSVRLPAWEGEIRDGA